MKKQITSILLGLGICFTLSAQQVINNPDYEFKNTGINTITQIDRNKDNTRVQILSEFVPHWWVSFDSTSYIRDADTGKKYFPIGIEGTEFGKQTFMPDSGDSTFVLIFPPFDKKMKKFDYVESETGGGSIYGVSLAKKKKQKKETVEESLYGTWQDMDKQLAPETDPSIGYGNDFFRKDTAHLRGYLTGYDPRAGFNTGMIYISNAMTREDYPTVVQIHPDGRFEADIPMNHAWEGYILFNRTSVPFYIEPGETLFISLNWEDFLMADRYRDRRYEFKHIKYIGASAGINNELRKFKTENFNYQEFQNAISKILPADFKEKQLADCKKASDLLAQKIQGTPISVKGRQLLQSKILLTFYGALFDYAMMRQYYASQDSTNEVLKQPLPGDYHSFMQNVDMNDKSMVAAGDFSMFINRFEYMQPFTQIYDKRFNQADDKWQILSQEWLLKDSILRNNLQIKPGLISDIAKTRSLNYSLGMLTPKEGLQLVNQLNISISEPFLQDVAMSQYTKKFPEGENQAYQLPEGKATDIFRKLVDPHKGKFVLVDFWATTCGPCIHGIKEMKPLRDKYKGSPDLAFVFITDQGGSPESAYNKFIAENDMGDNLFRLKTDDYNYLRQLFKFNGIPRYVMLDREGKVLNGNFPAYNAKEEFKKWMPEK